jgi:hypothetical protein
MHTCGPDAGAHLFVIPSLLIVTTRHTKMKMTWFFINFAENAMDYNGKKGNPHKFWLC